MKRTAHLSLILLGLIAAVLSGCRDTPDSYRLVVAFSSDSKGYLESCDFDSGKLGGLARHSYILDSLRREMGEEMLLIHTGNLHGSNTDLEAQQSALLMERILEQQGYSLIGLGPLDAVLPDSLLRPLVKQSEIPWLGSNYRRDTIPSQVEQVCHERINGLRITVLNWIDPNWEHGALGHNDLEGNLHEQIIRVRRECDVLVLIVYTDVLHPEVFLKQAAGADVVLLGGVGFPVMSESNLDGMLVGNCGDRGQYIGRFELELTREKRISSSKYVLIPVEPGLPEDSVTARRIREFKQEVRVQRREAQEAKRQQILTELDLDETALLYHDAKHFFLGARACKECHAGIYAAFEATPHATAYAALLRSGEEENPSELRRCVTGYLVRGGYVDRSSSWLYNVQCEACHGPGSAHVDANGGETGTLADPWQSCGTCHDVNAFTVDGDLDAGLHRVPPLSMLSK